MKKGIIGKIITWLIIVLILIAAGIYAVNYFFVKAYVDVAKNSSPSSFPNKTYAQSFDEFFDKTSWSKPSLFGDTIEFYGVKNTLPIKFYFNVDKNANYAVLTRIDVNGKIQDEFVRNYIIITSFNYSIYDFSTYEGASKSVADALEFLYKEYIPENIIRNYYNHVMQLTAEFGNPLRLPDVPKAANVTLPNLTGMSLTAAKAKVEELGLGLTIIEEESTKSVGTVFKTTPEPGKPVSVDSYVVLYVSKGKDVGLQINEESYIKSEELIKNYATKLPESINSGDFSKIASYFRINSMLATTRENYVKSIFNAGTKCEHVSLSIKSFNNNGDKTYTLTTTEVRNITLRTIEGQEQQYPTEHKYNCVYTIQQDDDKKYFIIDIKENEILPPSPMPEGAE